MTTRSRRWRRPASRWPTARPRRSRSATASPRSARCPRWCRRGINVTIGTDGNNASNYSDLHRATYLVAGLFKDARTDPQMFPAEMAYEMATLGGARTMLLEHEIGSLEPGKKADVVLHDTDRPEWRPLLNVINQLVWSADGRGVHTVFVDGRMVVEAGRMTTIDEDAPVGGRAGRRRGHHPALGSARHGQVPTVLTLPCHAVFTARDYGSSARNGLTISPRTKGRIDVNSTQSRSSHRAECWCCWPRQRSSLRHAAVTATSSDTTTAASAAAATTRRQRPHRPRPTPAATSPAATAPAGPRLRQQADRRRPRHER